MTDLEVKLKAAFKEELALGVTQLQTSLTQAQGSPAEKLPEVFSQIFQVSHLLKGAARAVGATAVESITGRMETLFYRLQSGALTNTDGLDAVMQSCVDYLTHAEDEPPPNAETVQAIVSSLDFFLNQEAAPDAIPDDLRIEIAQTFFVECSENVNQLRGWFTNRESPEALTQEEIEDAFRKAHTIKGGARLIEYHGLENQAHALEEILSQLKSGLIQLEETVSAKIGALLDTIENTLVNEQEKLAASIGNAAAKSLSVESPTLEMPADLSASIDELMAGIPIEHSDPTATLVEEQQALETGAAGVENTLPPLLSTEDLEPGLESDLPITTDLNDFSLIASNPPAAVAEPVVEITAAPEVEDPSVVEPLPELVVETLAEPVGEAAAEPVLEVAPEPVLKVAPEPVVEATAEPVVEAAAEPVVEAAAERVHEVAPEPVVEAAPEPVATQKPMVVEKLKIVPPPAAMKKPQLPATDGEASGAKPLQEFKAPPPPPKRSLAQTTASTPPPRNEAVKIQLENLDPLYKAVVSLHLEVQAHHLVTESLNSLSTTIGEIRGDWENTKKQTASVLRKLSTNDDTSRISHYFDLVGKQTKEIRAKLEVSIRKQKKAQWNLGILAQKLKRDVRRIYTVPASTIFFGFRKMISDIAVECKKEVNVVTLGLDVEGDRTVLQGLKEPVLHLVRNSIYHGIESPEDRVRVGKPRQGTVTIKLSKETTSLCAEITDDGKGLDYEKIRNKAVTLGKITAAEASKKTEAELLQFIFHAGFSTADDVNAIAGRGVGLSAVRKSLEEIGGKLEVASQIGKSCRFTLRIPLHVSTQPLILFQVDKQILAIPVSGVHRLVRIPNSSIKDVGTRRVATTPDGNLIFKPMKELLGAKVDRTTEPQHWSGMIIQCDDERVFVAVDALVGHKEAVLKKLGRIAEAWELICGGILLEDGRVAMVVDPRNLAKQVLGGTIINSKRPAAAARKADLGTVIPKRILVVDDSITTRTLEKSILETYGFDVELAVDGEDALNRLKRESFDLVVTDLEMPRLNGFGLVQALKGDEKLKHIPIIMVTSVESPKEREKGMANGADAYVVKQKFDQQELIQTIRTFL